MITSMLRFSRPVCHRLPRVGIARPNLLVPAVNRVHNARSYATGRREEAPKVRYLFYTFIFSTFVLYLATTQINKKQPKKSFSEDEFRAYEEETGLKRRSRLIKNEDREKYTFYAVPFVHRQKFIDILGNRLGSRQVKVIDPEEVIKKEIDSEGHYSILLQEVQANKKSMPKGLVTALIQNEIRNYLNTRNGTFDTNFILCNYPQTTDEAIKFENEVSEIKKCIGLHYDILNELEKTKGPEGARLVNNVLGYYDAVKKTKIITYNHDELDEKMQDVVLELL
ncbi:Piso0_005324 [Millerozyma farinosa CBS 7064]|uniref:Piso0_005324 protein n=1 Tax=Pichia sorbitophila (strain ATCC MYA-4447 / BCRC 22081 / CBS 7064 / NBRC 10061 / NRRL Y-12695) TaxID=559304 RepID=G8Y4T5_PICSO|nr:Piso0_005324 [Millerozyma farinosa CBS 7064]